MLTLAFSIYIVSIIIFLPRNARKALDNNQGCRRRYHYRATGFCMSNKKRANDRDECSRRYIHTKDCWREDLEVNNRDVLVGIWYGLRAPILYGIIKPITLTAGGIWWLVRNLDAGLLNFINKKPTPRVREKRKSKQIEELQDNIWRLEKEKEEWEREHGCAV